MLWDRSKPRYPARNNELGLSALRQPAQGGKIQMIVVIVAEEHGVDAGKILPPHPGLLRRRGPIQVSGLARSDQIGSVKIFEPLC